jgi:hypothetical protein
MEELVTRIAAATGLDVDTARKAASIVLAFLAKEAPADVMAALFAAVPGTAEAAASPDAAEGGGLLGGLAGMMGGGGVMALAGQLNSAGVPMGDLAALGKEFFAFGREKAGEDTVGAIVGAVPGLGQFV